ncbi:MAG: hypothetical protein EOP10_19860 [Proteobacteria bacterium]|nr:MAG: hypothetical protein EOP10_19860 [Pseudomonadota bacterium]
MSWKDSFLPASFRGAAFTVTVSEPEFSKRLAVHTFPGSDNHFIEELGLAPANFSVTAHVSGEDYDKAKSALIDACLAKGPGLLIHPYYGKISAHCQRCSPRESMDEQRKATFTLFFIPAGSETFPILIERPSGSVLNAADRLKEAAKEKFRGAYDFLAASGEEITAARTYLSSQLRAISDVGALSAGGFEAAVDISSGISFLSTDLSRALSAPDRVAEIMDSAVSLIRGSGGSLRANIFELQNFGKNALGKVFDAGSTARKSLTEASASLFSALATARVAEFLASHIENVKNSARATDFDDPIEILSEEFWRETLETAIEDIEEKTLLTKDLIEFELLTELGESLLLLSESEDVFALPNLQRYVLPFDMPLPVAAFKIYGSIDRARELQRLNLISDPVMIEKGRVLEYFAYE